MTKKNTHPDEDGQPDPLAPPLDSIHHIAVVVPDVEKGVIWYSQNFHCTVEYVDDTWALLNFANTKLALVLPHQHPAHVAITRSDAQKFGNLTTHRDGIQSTYIQDVAGNPLEILKSETIEAPPD